MDTNQNNEQNNILINSFTKGMNSDISLDMVSNEQYIFGKNIRITLNSLLNSDLNVNYKEGIITPIQNGEYIELPLILYSEILATASIENIGVIIVRDNTGDSTWSIYRITLNDDETLDVTKIFTSFTTLSEDKHKLSIVLNKEIEDVIKLYIADGEHIIMLFNVGEKYDDYNEGLGGNIDYTMLNRLFPDDKILIVKFISGKLKSSQVLYTYRFYKKYGVCSKLAPMTNKIQIISTTRDLEDGNKEDTQTSLGLRLRIDCSTHKWIHLVFDRVLVFRLTYIKSETDCDVELVCDKSIKDIDTLQIEDTGDDSLQQLSIEEFASLQGLDLIPLCIELNLNYMFVSNVEDKTVLRTDNIDSRAFSFNKAGNIELYSENNYDAKYIFSSLDAIKESEELYGTSYYINRYGDVNYLDEEEDPCKYVLLNENTTVYGGDGFNVSWKFITTPIITHDTAVEDYTPPSSDKTTKETGIYYFTNQGTMYNSGRTTTDYFNDCGIYAQDYIGYDDPIVSSTLRSLKYNEVYRYGIVFYNEYGNRSDVQWIGDIRTPDFLEMNEFTNFQDEDAIVKKYKGSISAKSWVEYEYEGSPEEGLTNIKILDKEYASNVESETYIIQKGYSYEISAESKCVDYQTRIDSSLYSVQTKFYKIVDGEKIELTESYNPTYVSGTATEDMKVLVEIVSLMALPEQDEQKISGTNETWIEYTLEYSIIASKDIENSNSSSVITDKISNAGSISIPIGIHFDVNVDKSENIIGYQIVRCLKLDQYTTNLHQCFVTGADKYAKGPYIPCGLTRYITETSVGNIEGSSTCENIPLKQPILLYSPYVSTYPETTKSNIKTSGLNIMPVYQYSESGSSELKSENETYSILHHFYNRKVSENNNQYLVDDIDNTYVLTWDTILTNVYLNGSEVANASASYKSAITTVKNYQYVNAAMEKGYDLDPTDWFTYYKNDTDKRERHNGHKGDGYRIGCGPKCLVAAINAPNSTDITLKGNVVTLRHSATLFAGITKEEHLYDTYYGFGNYCKLKSDSSSSKMTGSIDVFDGDVYYIPCEIILKYKTYNSNSLDGISTEQLILYIPLETKMNTFFNYGMNYRNTLSQWLQPEPGDIEGIFSQSRPDFLYNNIYSDNNISNDIYSAKTLDELNNTYPLRIFYSDLKTNGESLDSWNIFRSSNYLDIDTRYGQITDTLSVKDVLYYWQTDAFGKINVNERSLITDDNSNKILLGTGGVVQKADYIDTTYGMRKNDFSAIYANNMLFWIDVTNKAIVTEYNGKAVNYSELTNVQNLVNKKINDTNVPYIDYDKLNQELICKCSDEDQIIFNLKLNCASSVYTRKYDHTIILNSTLYGLILYGGSSGNLYLLDSDSKYLTDYENYYLLTGDGPNVCNIYKLNNIKKDHSSLVSPTEIKFVVNGNPSITKVFDNQQIVILDSIPAKEYFGNKSFEFTTQLSSTTNTPDGFTDREGNIKYSVPRYGNVDYGNRMRGKWMTVDIMDTDPQYKDTISHIITKFRQSFS